MGATLMAQILPFVRRCKVFGPDATLAMGEAYDKAMGTIHTDASEDLMRDPTRKRQKEWSSEPLMCTVDRGQLHLSVPSGLCAWRSAPE